MPLREIGDLRDARIEPPHVQAITALPDERPVSRVATQSQREFLLIAVSLGGASVQIKLTFVSPQAWTASSGRAWMPLLGPPPKPPRLGTRR